eukprot:scaffold65847_cov18-Tisochrysis_lutea.AAC.1
MWKAPAVTVALQCVEGPRRQRHAAVVSHGSVLCGGGRLAVSAWWIVSSASGGLLAVLVWETVSSTCLGDFWQLKCSKGKALAVFFSRMLQCLFGRILAGGTRQRQSLSNNDQ